MWACRAYFWDISTQLSGQRTHAVQCSYCSSLWLRGLSCSDWCVAGPGDYKYTYWKYEFTIQSLSTKNELELKNFSQNFKILARYRTRVTGHQIQSAAKLTTVNLIDYFMCHKLLNFGPRLLHLRPRFFHHHYTPFDDLILILDCRIPIT